MPHTRQASLGLSDRLLSGSVDETLSVGRRVEGGMGRGDRNVLSSGL